MPGIFDPARQDLGRPRADLQQLTTHEEYRALRRTTLNAHYTHARYAQAIWTALADLGFTSGTVLEPGCGSGNFIGLAPAGARMTGIELDPVTAGIAAALYPDADIRPESFADTRIPAGHFDAVVGNVPFGSIKLSDRRHNPGRRLSIHDHFIIKALALTRPGGMVAVLTSRYTMDARNPQVRRQIAGMADLAGAIRLPTGAHRQAAGTDVVTDLLILRRRSDGAPPRPVPWEKALPVSLPGGQANINQYFTDHPGFVLGQMRVRPGARGPELEVAGGPDTAQELAGALERVTAQARGEGLVMSERTGEPAPEPPPALAPDGDEIEGLIQSRADGTFTRLTVSASDSGPLTAQPYQPPARQAAELRALTGLRDTVLALLRAEGATLEDTPEIDRIRARLNASYGAYVARYGPVKRFTWAQAGHADPASGERKQARRRPGQGGFRSDPLYPLVYALEESYDPVTGTAVRADIFTERVVVPEPPLLGADTPAEALAICLNSFAEVRLDEIARLLGTPGEAEARAELATLIYDEPSTGKLIWAPLYLSGNVREKLTAAEEAAAADPRFEANAQVLREVIPRDLGPAEIEAQLGAGWIAVPYVQQFLAETLDDPDVTVTRTRNLTWRITGGNRKTVAATSVWGTADICAHDLAQRLLTGTADEIKVSRKTSSGSETDHQATEAARQKSRDLADRFSRWTWEDPDRAASLCRTYNDRYNAVVPVSFDNVKLLTSGLSPAITLRGHQPAAIARIIYQGSAGLVHDTGAGKTLETIVGVYERQRLGLSAKPCFVVQKHKLGDFREEFLRAYPAARILAADTDDLTGSKRREFIARCATGNPTAIIMSREAFKTIPVSAARQEAFLAQEKKALERAIEEARAAGDDDRTIKQMEHDLVNAEERRKEQLASIGRDRGLCYEDTGIDYLVIDEAQGYRKGPVASSLPGMADPGSQRSLDLLLKLGYHADRYGETRICLATATPFANRISEIYTWLRYLAGDIEDFDSWCRTFGKMATAYEMTPAGDFKAKARLRDIINAVDLHLQLRERTDIKLKNDLDLDLPAMTGGKPQIIEVPATPEHLDYATEIRHRYQHLPAGPPQKGADNHLKIQGDAIKAALDLRLVGRPASEPQKAEVTANVLYAKWLQHRDDIYHRVDGTEHPVKGSLILVFASLGTPGSARKATSEDGEPRPFSDWNFYTELREQLAARGMPRRLIRFIHEAANAQQKEELYHACRTGGVAVLIGSTEKLGTGTNVQDRAVGLVQVTAPWNWDEPHQEIGRVERQGNQNTEFFCIRVVTSPSADAIKWERARQKEQSFRALLSGQISGRTIHVPDDDLSSAEVMAAASGDSRLLERAELEGSVIRLATLRRAWAQDQTALDYKARHADRGATRAQQAADQISAALPSRRDTRGNAFAMTLDGTRFTKRTEAAARLRDLIRQHIRHVQRGTMQRAALGEIGGLGLTATLAPAQWSSVILHLDGIPDLPEPIALDHRALPDQYGMITRLENRLADLDRIRDDAASSTESLRREAAAARASIGAPFPQENKYEQARARLTALEKDLIGDPGETGNLPGQDSNAGYDRPESTASHAAGPGSSPRHSSRANPRPDPSPADLARETAVQLSVPDASAFADYYAAVYGHEPSGVQPLASQVYYEEWLPQQPADHPLRQAPPAVPASPSPPASGANAPAPATSSPAAGQAPPAAASSATSPDHLRRLAARHGLTVRADNDTSGADQDDSSSAAPAARVPDRAAPENQPATAATPREPGQRQAGVSQLLIEHHQASTLIHGTSGYDRELHRILSHSQFRWSGRLGAWYLPRNWRFPTRDARVGALTANLQQISRPFQVLDHPPDPAERARPAPIPQPAPAVPERAANAGETSASDKSAPVATADRRPVPSPPQQPAPRIEEDLRRLAAEHGLSFESGHISWGRGQLVTLHDQGRTILLHDDVSGTTIGGARLSAPEIPAYLAAWRKYPHLPPSALLRLAGPEPAAAALPLSQARQLAGLHDLTVGIVRVGGQAYITLHEPDVPAPPALSYPVGSACAFHGPCAVPLAAINGYLLAYRSSVPPAMFRASRPVHDWGRRIAQLTPHLVEGSGYFDDAVRQHVRAAISAARAHNEDQAARSLDRAENAAPPLTLTPDREAGVVQAIRDNAPGCHRVSGNPGRYIAEGHVQASARELDWINAYIAAHPDVLAGDEVPQARHMARDAAGREEGRRRGATAAQQAWTEFEGGDRDRALSLLDEAELLDPGQAGLWEQRRSAVRDAPSPAPVPDPGNQPPAGEPETQAGAAVLARPRGSGRPGLPAGQPPSDENRAAPTLADATGASAPPPQVALEEAPPPAAEAPEALPVPAADLSGTGASIPASQLRVGDAVQLPGYAGGPFTLIAAPEDHRDHVSLIGEARENGRPYFFHWKYPKNGVDDPVFARALIPVAANRNRQHSADRPEPSQPAEAAAYPGSTEEAPREEPGATAATARPADAANRLDPATPTEAPPESGTEMLPERPVTRPLSDTGQGTKRRHPADAARSLQQAAAPGPSRSPAQLSRQVAALEQPSGEATAAPPVHGLPVGMSEPGDAGSPVPRPPDSADRDRRPGGVPDATATPADGTAQRTGAPSPEAAAQSAADLEMPEQEEGEAPAGPAADADHTAPVTNHDLAIALRRMSPQEIAVIVRAAMDQKTPAAIGMHGSSSSRRNGEPDAGTWEELDFGARGIRIRITAPSETRAGLVGWRRVTDWIRPGVTQPRLYLLEEAARADAAYRIFADGFTVTGQQQRYRIAQLELNSLLGTAAREIIDAALRARPAGRLDSGFSPARRRPRRGENLGATSLFAAAETDPGGSAALLSRIRQLMAALPEGAPASPLTRISRLRPGDAIYHPGYAGSPFVLQEPPEDHGDYITLTGEVTGYRTRDRVITWQYHKNGTDDPVIATVPLPLPAGGTAAQQSLANNENAEPTVPAGKPGTAPQQLRQAADAGTARGRAGSPAEAAPADPAAPSASYVSATLSRPGTVDASGSGQPAETAERDLPRASPPSASSLNHSEEPPAAVVAGGEAVPGASADHHWPAGLTPSTEDAMTTPPSGTAAPSFANEFGDLDRGLVGALAALAAGQAAASAEEGFAGIHAAFAELRQGLSLPAPGHSRPARSEGHGVAGPPRTEDPSARNAPSHSAATDDNDFAGIHAAFTELRQVLGLRDPSRPQHAGGQGDRDRELAPDTQQLDHAIAEAQACAAWYSDTPEWQRIARVSDAAGALMKTIRETAGDYWAEIRQDIRLRGLARTVTARVTRVIASTASSLADRLERAGWQQTRAWRAARTLHLSATSFAGQLMRYSLPGGDERLGDVNQIISDLRRSMQTRQSPQGVRESAPREDPGPLISPAVLARTSFPQPLPDVTMAPAMTGSPPTGPARSSVQAGQCAGAPAEFTRDACQPPPASAAPSRSGPRRVASR